MTLSSKKQWNLIQLPLRYNNKNVMFLKRIDVYVCSYHECYTGMRDEFVEWRSPMGIFCDSARASLLFMNAIYIYIYICTMFDFSLVRLSAFPSTPCWDLGWKSVHDPSITGLDPDDIRNPYQE